MATICLVLFFWKWPLRTHGFCELYVIGFTKQVLFKTPQEFLCDYAGDVLLTVQFSIDQNYHEWCNFQICLIVKFHSVQIISIGSYNKKKSRVWNKNGTTVSGVELYVLSFFVLFPSHSEKKLLLFSIFTHFIDLKQILLAWLPIPALILAFLISIDVLWILPKCYCGFTIVHCEPASV